MALHRGKANPLSVLGERKLSFIPGHFATLTLKGQIDIKLVDHWISYHLNSRYAIRTKMSLNTDNKIVEVTEIGLEDPRELSLFSIGCPYIHKH